MYFDRYALYYPMGIQYIYVFLHVYMLNLYYPSGQADGIADRYDL